MNWMAREWEAAHPNCVTCSEALARRIFESVSCAVMVTDSRGLILDVNAAFELITGYTRAEAQGRPSSLLSSGRHPRSFYADMWRSLLETGRWEGEILDRRKTGELYPKWMSIDEVSAPGGGLAYYVAVFSDISERKSLETERALAVNYDALTGLPNRSLFRDRLEHELRLAQRRDGALALLCVDLDGFRRLNDSLGHSAGDQLLLEVARRLRGAVRASDTVARLGGDEFAVMLPDLAAEGDAARLARKLIERLGDDFDLGGRRVHIEASVGVTLFPEDGWDAARLQANANLALDAAQQEGGGRVRFFSEDLGRRARDRLDLEADLRLALAAGQLLVHLQPRVCACDEQLLGAEALVRWQHPERGLVQPGQFIPLAEETGLIVPLGDWVFRRACRLAVSWAGRVPAGFRVAVNLSPRQLSDPDLLDRFRRILADEACPGSLLELEITESGLADDPGAAAELLVALEALGITVAVDDFGTGHSSLAHLKRFPLHVLKIDRSFVMGLPEDENDLAIVRAVAALAESLGLGLVAEGVETPEQLALLQQMGCPEIQGFLLGRPVAPEDFAARWLG